MPRAAAPYAPPGAGMRSEAPTDILRGRAAQQQAEVAAAQDAAGLLERARQAALKGNASLSNEFVERAEARLLTRSTVPGTESIPVGGGILSRTGEARAALARRDRAAAAALLSEAAGMARSLAAPSPGG